MILCKVILPQIVNAGQIMRIRYVEIRFFDGVCCRTIGGIARHIFSCASLTCFATLATSTAEYYGYEKDKSKKDNFFIELTSN